MSDTPSFAKLVPGFEFLQGLMKSAGSGVPGMSQWIAPTLDPEELDKRIEQLKTVLFWLEQNARMINTSIQALEVQRMTLSTLHSMNVPLTDMVEALKARSPAPAPAPAAASTPAPEPELETPPAAEPAAGNPASDPSATSAAAIDPMQWWGALTRQFSDLAAGALKEMAAENRASPAAPATSEATRKPAPQATRKASKTAAGKQAGKPAANPSAAKSGAKSTAKGGGKRT